MDFLVPLHQLWSTLEGEYMLSVVSTVCFICKWRIMGEFIDRMENKVCCRKTDRVQIDAFKPTKNEGDMVLKEVTMNEAMMDGRV